MRKVEFIAVERREGELGTNWEGPYKVVQVLTPKNYKLEDLYGKELPHSWNI